MRFLKVLFVTLFVVLILAATSAYIILMHYKKEIASMVIDTLKTEHGVELAADDIRISFFSNWPHASVQLKHVNIQSDKFPGSYIKAGGLGLSLNLRKMLQKEFIVRNISLNNAEIVFVKQPPPDDPVTVQPPGAEDTTSLVFEVRRITFRDTKFRYRNPRIGQEIAINLLDNSVTLQHFSDGISARLRGRVYVPALVFNAKRGEFLKESKARLNVNFDYFKKTRSICIRPGSTADVNGHTFNVAALIDLETRRLALMIKSKEINYDRTARLMNPKIRRIMSNFELKNPVDASMLLVVNMGQREDPILMIDFAGKNNDLMIGTSKIPYSDLSFTGRITCIDPSGKRGNMQHAQVTLSKVKGKIYRHPFTAKVTVKNLEDPFISIRGKMHIDAKKIKSRLNDEFVLKGNAVAKISYSGPASHLNSREFLEPVMKLKAEVQLNDVSYREKEKPWEYTINGTAFMNNEDLKFDELAINSDLGKAEASGKIEGFVDYVLGFTNGFKANLAVRTDSLDLNPFLRKKKLMPVDSVRVLSSSVAPDVATGEEKTDIMNAANAMKKTYSSFEFNVGLFAKKMLVRNVTATNAHLHLHYLRELLQIHSMAADVCEGKIKGSGTVKNFNSIKADVSIEDVDVKEMFRQFENFGQDVVSSENIEGRIYAEAKFKSLLDDRLEIAGETMYGEVKLSLKDGHLINFEPIQNLSNFLFKNRDFNNVSFSELNESFIVRGYEMQIDELEIGSNILNLFVVNGLYNFKGHSNINLLVPWSNLKKRSKHFIPRTSGDSAENAKGVKLNFSGPSKKMKISLGHKELSQEKPSI
jgi:hypothetical protein